MVMNMVLIMMTTVTMILIMMTTVTMVLHISQFLRLMRTRFWRQATCPLIALLRAFLPLSQLLQVKLFVGNLDVADINSLFLESLVNGREYSKIVNKGYSVDSKNVTLRIAFGEVVDNLSRLRPHQKEQQHKHHVDTSANNYVRRVLSSHVSSRSVSSPQSSFRRVNMVGIPTIASIGLERFDSYHLRLRMSEYTRMLLSLRSVESR